MYTIVNLPAGTEVSKHTLLTDAQLALSVIETEPPSHEITGEAEPAPEVSGEEIG